MHKVLIGNALSAPSRQLLQTWLLGSTTGDKRLKAGPPPNWRIDDKTGTNALDTNNIAIVWPPSRPPWRVAAYLSGSQGQGVGACRGGQADARHCCLNVRCTCFNAAPACA